MNNAPTKLEERGWQRLVQTWQNLLLWEDNPQGLILEDQTLEEKKEKKKIKKTHDRMNNLKKKWTTKKNQQTSPLYDIMIAIKSEDGKHSDG